MDQIVRRVPTTEALSTSVAVFAAADRNVGGLRRAANERVGRLARGREKARMGNVGQRLSVAVRGVVSTLASAQLAAFRFEKRLLGFLGFCRRREQTRGH